MRLMTMLTENGQHGLADLCSTMPAAVIKHLLARQTTPPPAHQALVRPRLLSHLDEALRHRLTTLAAPAGSGKHPAEPVGGR